MQACQPNALGNTHVCTHAASHPRSHRSACPCRCRMASPGPACACQRTHAFAWLLDRGVWQNRAAFTPWKEGRVPVPGPIVQENTSNVTVEGPEGRPAGPVLSRHPRSAYAIGQPMASLLRLRPRGVLGREIQHAASDPRVHVQHVLHLRGVAGLACHPKSIRYNCTLQHSGT